MYLLLAHDYAKLWKAENKAIEVKRFEFAGEENERLCRRYILRSLQKKKRVDELKPRFIMKRFQNIPSKVLQYMRPRETVKRNIEAEKPVAKEDSELEEACSRLSKTRDSAEIVREKLGKVSAGEQHMDVEQANISLCSDVLECTSDLDVVSRCSKHQDLSNLEVPQKNSYNAMEGHVHILCDGSHIRVKAMPHDGHKHRCKLLARHCH